MDVRIRCARAADLTRSCGSSASSSPSRRTSAPTPSASAPGSRSCSPTAGAAPCSSRSAAARSIGMVTGAARRLDRGGRPVGARRGHGRRGGGARPGRRARASSAAIEAWARARGATRLQLLADRENAPALAFYARVGWRATRLVCLRRGGR